MVFIICQYLACVFTFIESWIWDRHISSDWWAYVASGYRRRQFKLRRAGFGQTKVLFKVIWAIKSRTKAHDCWCNDFGKVMSTYGIDNRYDVVWANRRGEFLVTWRWKSSRRLFLQVAPGLWMIQVRDCGQKLILLVSEYLPFSGLFVNLILWPRLIFITWLMILHPLISVKLSISAVDPDVGEFCTLLGDHSSI